MNTIRATATWHSGNLVDVGVVVDEFIAGETALSLSVIPSESSGSLDMILTTTRGSYRGSVRKGQKSLIFEATTGG